VSTSQGDYVSFISLSSSQYPRMSTGRQKFSLENQSAAVRLYAERNDFVVLTTYANLSKTGVVLKHRKVLQVCCATWSKQTNLIK
jgi:DNA invertase Pin-like site-specific DNA recombinase